MKMKYGYLWIVLRLMKKQKLRTYTIFCGILFSTFLLAIFGRLGYYFWNLVHEGASEFTQFDATQWILDALVMVLSLLAAACSVILLYHLFSLTFVQKWHSLCRLMELGAALGDMIYMTAAETGMIYCVAAPLGEISAFLLVKWIGIHCDFPIWMSVGILVCIFILSCICGVKPVLCTVHRPLLQRAVPYRGKVCENTKSSAYSVSFTSFMLRKYFRADRGHYIRTILTMATIMVLYVSVEYFVNTNLRIQQSKLPQKYGIQYSCLLKDDETMAASLEECRNLANVNKDADSMIYIQLAGKVSVQSELLSRKLLGVLKEAGWDRQEIWESDTDIYFLDDAHYEIYLNACMIQKTVEDSEHPLSVLVNRYRNRTKYKADGNGLFPEVSLINPDQWNENLSIKMDYGIDEWNENYSWTIHPDCLLEKMPEGIDFTGKVTMILPLSHLKRFCASMTDFRDVVVYGCFEDQNRDLFRQLSQELKPDSMGKLVYIRKELQEWYDSMKEIRLAMISICAVLFSIALLHYFCTMIFHYYKRKRALAVLWSLGQTENGLLRMLVLENIRIFAIAMISSIPVSCTFCYVIYSIFRRVWNIGFVLPFENLVLIVAAAGMAATAATAIDHILMKKQNFLQNIRDVTN